MTNSFQQQAAYKTVCSRITDFLYVSGVDVAKDLNIMNSCGITHVINMCGCSAPNYFPLKFQYQRLPIRDHNSVDISPLLLSLVASIERVRSNGGVVLVHCVKGISRSTTVAIAYLMWSKRMDLNTAFRFVKTCRPIINPNAGFFFQLNDWGNQLEVHQARALLSPADQDRDACMFRIRSPCDVADTTGDGYSSLPEIDGPFGCHDDVPPATSEEQCFVFHKNSMGPVLWHRQHCNLDLLAQAREACVTLQHLGMLPAARTVVECAEASEPEAMRQTIARMRSVWKID